jgi:hypothetical protein
MASIDGIIFNLDDVIAATSTFLFLDRGSRLSVSCPGAQKQAVRPWPIAVISRYIRQRLPWE